MLQRKCVFHFTGQMSTWSLQRAEKETLRNSTTKNTKFRTVTAVFTFFQKCSF